MESRENYHMSPDEFRRRGREIVDWVADYMEKVGELPVQSRVQPGEILAKLPASPPERGEDFAAMIADLDELILPGISHWQSPSWFGYFPSNNSGPSILGDLVSAGLGVQGMIWQTSPACTELETRVMDWLAELLDLPGRFRSTGAGGGVIQDTASSSSLCALIAARERSTGLAGNREGCARDLTVYASREAHSLVQKAVRIAGIGDAHLRRIDTDAAFAMDPGALAAAIEADVAAGLRPCFVVATVGTTSSNAMDPLRAIGEICRAHGIWLHVDAAMSGTAALCPEFRWIHEGLELADSYTVNPHKWMFTNFDCNAFWVADRKALIDAFAITPEYLRNSATESGAVIDYRDWHIPLGRRFRSLKLWFVLRWYGAEGLRHHVRRHVELAQEFAGWVDADPDFEIAAPHPLNLICFRHLGGDETNERIQERVNGGGRMFITHTRLAGKYTLRLCVGQSGTESEHVEAAWRLLRDAAE